LMLTLSLRRVCLLVRSNYSSPCLLSDSLSSASFGGSAWV
jgi:hypothetical protein